MVACDPTSAFFGFMGVTSAIVFANLGAAYGTAKSGVGIMSMGVLRPELMMKSIIPVVMAGVLGMQYTKLINNIYYLIFYLWNVCMRMLIVNTIPELTLDKPVSN